ncbi:(2Fe-2S) ferredoxin domain-containing protein [Leptolyngbya sp. FACHB-16]|nr:(2Fe-2S) ferredoxin domain-containing protein [Leptolyngbya sp. FACHB-16]MBD1909532.1 (2Fe-2S) ferredoxin domain-containing protein [Leptolyngbya sp. FACHB-8]MBD2154622.1 (2Fe-2S) ferredoxin domain-containing protein [Leptolyngbya sp. FACHB-16]
MIRPDAGLLGRHSTHRVPPYSSTLVPESSSPKRRLVVVCQNRSCLRSGSDAVLAALQAAAPSGTFVQATGCLGQCGAGPMVLVNPDGIWYCQVDVADVPEIVSEHFEGDRPVQRRLHPRFHPRFDASSYNS